jgi:tRNA threonylcarbamoyladenosine modification (KEOPS) complex  Pcc1 subunit
MIAEKYIEIYSEERWKQIYQAILNYYWPEVKGLNINIEVPLPKDVSRVIQCYYRTKWRAWYKKSNPDLNDQSVEQVLNAISTEDSKILFLKGFLISSFERVMYLK